MDRYQRLPGARLDQVPAYEQHLLEQLREDLKQPHELELAESKNQEDASEPFQQQQQLLEALASRWRTAIADEKSERSKLIKLSNTLTQVLQNHRSRTVHLISAHEIEHRIGLWDRVKMYFKNFSQAWRLLQFFEKNGSLDNQSSHTDWRSLQTNWNLLIELCNAAAQIKNTIQPRISPIEKLLKQLELFNQLDALDIRAYKFLHETWPDEHHTCTLLPVDKKDYEEVEKDKMNKIKRATLKDIHRCQMKINHEPMIDDPKQLETDAGEKKIINVIEKKWKNTLHANSKQRQQLWRVLSMQQIFAKPWEDITTQLARQSFYSSEQQDMIIEITQQDQAILINLSLPSIRYKKPGDEQVLIQLGYVQQTLIHSDGTISYPMTVVRDLSPQEHAGTGLLKEILDEVTPMISDCPSVSPSL